MLTEIDKNYRARNSQIDDPRFDRGHRRVGDARISPTQWAILEILWAHKPYTVQKSALINLLWRETRIKDPGNVLYVLVNRLRRTLLQLAIDPRLPRYEIVTVRGQGYLLRAQPGGIEKQNTQRRPYRRTSGILRG